MTHDTPETAAPAPKQTTAPAKKRPDKPTSRHQANPEVDYNRGIVYVEEAARGKHGERNTNIRNAASSGVPYGEVASKFGVSVDTVLDIIGQTSTPSREQAQKETFVEPDPQYVVSPGPSVALPPKATIPAE